MFNVGVKRSKRKCVTNTATLFPSSSPKGDDVRLGQKSPQSWSEVVSFIRWITAGRFSDGARGLDSQWEAPPASPGSACDASAVLVSGGKLQTETDLSGCFVLTGSAVSSVLF